MQQFLNWSVGRLSGLESEIELKRAGNKRGRSTQSKKTTEAPIEDLANVSTLTSRFFRDPAGGADFVYPLGANDQQLFSYCKEDMMDDLKLLGARKKEKQDLTSLVNAYEKNGQEVDWVKIAVEMSKICKAQHTAIECFCVYNNDMASNKAKWAIDEEKKLAELARTYSEHEWVAIAEKLGTGRTPFQCLKHFQQAINTKLTTMAEWTPEEERILQESVLLHGDKNWQHISSTLPGRTAKQCNFKWRKSSGVFDDGVVNGVWNEEEERRLFLGVLAHEIPFLDDFKLPPSEVQKFSGLQSGIADVDGRVETAGTAVVDAVKGKTGKRNKYVKVTSPAGDNLPAPSWGRVAEVVIGRNDTRCRDKWTCSMDPTISTEPFSSAEDELILALVDKFGSSAWVTVSRYMKGRSDSQCSSRWLLLTKKTDKKKITERKIQDKKRKSVVPPSFGRSDTVSGLSSEDFVKVLRVNI